MTTTLLTRCAICAHPLGRHNAYTARCPDDVVHRNRTTVFVAGQDPLTWVVQTSQRLSAPLIDGFVRVTTWPSDLPPDFISTMHEYLWTTEQGHVRMPFFKWTPIYDQLCRQMKFWPVEVSDEEHERYVNQKPFWRYDEYTGKHRQKETP